MQLALNLCAIAEWYVGYCEIGTPTLGTTHHCARIARERNTGFESSIGRRAARHQFGFSTALILLTEMFWPQWLCSRLRKWAGRSFSARVESQRRFR